MKGSELPLKNRKVKMVSTQPTKENENLSSQVVAM